MKIIRKTELNNIEKQFFEKAKKIKKKDTQYLSVSPISYYFLIENNDTGDNIIGCCAVYKSLFDNEDYILAYLYITPDYNIKKMKSVLVKKVIKDFKKNLYVTVHGLDEKEMFKDEDFDVVDRWEKKGINLLIMTNEKQLVTESFDLYMDKIRGIKNGKKEESK